MKETDKSLMHAVITSFCFQLVVLFTLGQIKLYKHVAQQEAEFGKPERVKIQYQHKQAYKIKQR